MYLLIEHCNGEIMNNPFIVYNEKDLIPFLNGDYLIYYLDDTIYDPDYNINYLKEKKD